MCFEAQSGDVAEWVRSVFVAPATIVESGADKLFLFAGMNSHLTGFLIEGKKGCAGAEYR